MATSRATFWLLPVSRTFRGRKATSSLLAGQAGLARPLRETYARPELCEPALLRLAGHLDGRVHPVWPGALLADAEVFARGGELRGAIWRLCRARRAGAVWRAHRCVHCVHHRCGIVHWHLHAVCVVCRLVPRPTHRGTRFGAMAV